MKRNDILEFEDCIQKNDLIAKVQSKFLQNIGIGNDKNGGALVKIKIDDLKETYNLCISTGKIKVFCYKNLRGIENKELANSLINGIKSNGFLDVYK